MESIRWYIRESLKNIVAYATITDGNILTKILHRHISSGKCFFQTRIFHM